MSDGTPNPTPDPQSDSAGAASPGAAAKANGADPKAAAAPRFTSMTLESLYETAQASGASSGAEGEEEAKEAKEAKAAAASKAAGERRSPDPEGKEAAPGAKEGTGAETAAAGEDPGEGEGEGGGEGELQFATLQELFEHLDVDWESAKDLAVEVSIGGESKPVPFTELVKGYRAGAVMEKQLAEAGAEAKEITAAAQARAEAVEESYAVAAKLIEQAEQFLDDDAKNIDWAKLREEDPAEYAAKRDELRERREKLEKMKADTVQSYKDGRGKVQQADPKEAARRRAESKATLLKTFPEWQDQERAREDVTALTTYLAKDGFTPEQIERAEDPRLLGYAEKARRWDALQAKTGARRQKLNNVPKVLQPGGKKDDAGGAKNNRDTADILYG